MANTVNIIDLSNTFGEWLATTVQLTNEYNDLAANDWTKSSGDFIVESANSAFIVQSGSSATFQVPVEISGASANLVVRASSDFQEPALFSNTTTSFTASGNVSISKNLVATGNVTGNNGIFNNIVSPSITQLYSDFDDLQTSVNNSISSANTDMKNYVDTTVTTANTNMKNYVDTANTNMKNYVDTANTNLRIYTNTQISANAVSANAVISKANTDLKNYVDSNYAPKSSPTITNATITNGTLSGITANTSTLNNPTVTNYTETLFTATGSTTVNLSNGTVQKITTNGNITITLPNSVAGKSYVILVAYTGNHTVTWAGGSTIKWSYGTQPPQTRINGKIDIFTFFCDGTATYGGSFGPNF